MIASASGASGPESVYTLGHNVHHSLATIHGSAIGFPLTNTTTVGVPVFTTASTSARCAPTSARLLRSTCSPVVAFVPGSHRRVWSRLQVPTMTTATSDTFAAASASGNCDSSFDQSSQPCAKWSAGGLGNSVSFASSWVKPWSGVRALRVALWKT